MRKKVYTKKLPSVKLKGTGIFTFKAKRNIM